MKKTIILLFFISSLIFSQERYLIYFKDKEISKNSVLNKSSSAYLKALSNLSKKSIERREKHNPDNIIFYEDLPIKQQYIDSLESLGIQIKHQLHWFNCISAHIPNEIITKIEKLSFVEKIERVKSFYFKSSFSQSTLDKKLNDYGSSYTQLSLSDIPIVHSKGITGENVLIGVLDTGFDWQRHEAFKRIKIISEYDFINKDTITANQIGDPRSQDSHGTYVLSIIAGYKDSVLIGSSFNSSFLLAKTENISSETNVEEDDYAAAIMWMENLGVDITTSSLGYSEFDPGNRSYTYKDMNGKTTLVAKALNYAFQRGVVTFTSAGNEGNTSWKYIISPADAFDVIAVGAVNSQNQLASFSSRGPTSDGRIKPEVVAMGVSVFGASSGSINQYITASGTSAAAPIAAGVGALLLSKYPHLKNYQVRNVILESSANSANPNNQIGYGLISAKNAIEYPNLMIKENQFLINKIIFDENVNHLRTKMYLSVNNSDYNEINYLSFSNLQYQFPVPQLNLNDKINFYFIIYDSTGNSKRIPQNDSYSFFYGSLQINLNIKTESYTYSRISEIYPNPFIPTDHNYTRIKYKSLGNEKVDVSIIDASGQVVKQISQISSLGENFIEWDGISDRGYLCASGVYYFLINIGNENYGKKLILLK